jgi:lysophospholipase L1-like esterase
MPARTAPTDFSVGKSLAFSLILFALLMGLIEGTARVAAFVRNDWNPAYLIYGIRTVSIDGREGHTSAQKGYFKFPPHRTLHQYGKVSASIRINNLGFRGPDFPPEPGTDEIRVVAMGESSTFGYYSPDDATYPFLLGEILSRRLPGRKVSVLNAGIPHMTTDHMLAMLREEILAYRPSIVTLYSGYNDASTVMGATWAQAADRWAHGHLASYIALKWVISKVIGPMAGLTTAWSDRDWARHLSTVDAEYIRAQIRLHEEHYDRNLREFVALVRGGGAEPVFVRQRMTTNYLSPEYSFRHSDGPPPDGLSYLEEVEWMSTQLERSGRLSAYEAILLIHRGQLAVLDRVAAELRVPIVDNVAIMDEHPEYHASFVHLTPEGNAALAAALANRLGPHLR